MGSVNAARIGAIAFAVAMMAAMAPTNGRAAETGLVGTGWRIIEIAGRPAAPAAMIVFEKTRVSGSTGCNRFFGALHVKADAISFGPLATTKMYCGTRAQVEHDTLDALGKVTGSRLDGNRAALLDASGKSIVSLAR